MRSRGDVQKKRVPVSKMPRRSADIWVPVKHFESSWRSMVEGVRTSGCLAEGPVFVFHHTKRDDEVLQKKLLRPHAKKHAKDPLFQRFNWSKANGAWPLVQARLGPKRLEELVEDDPKLAAEQHALATRMLAYPSYVVQRFEGLDQVFEGCCSLFKTGGRFAFCEGSIAYRWCCLGGNAVLAHHDHMDVDTVTKDMEQEWAEARQDDPDPDLDPPPLDDEEYEERRWKCSVHFEHLQEFHEWDERRKERKERERLARREAGLVDWTELEQEDNKWTKLEHDVRAALGDQQGPLFVAHRSHNVAGLWQTEISRWPDGRRRWKSPEKPSRAGVPRPPFQDFNGAADNKAWPLVEAGLWGHLIGDLLPDLPEDSRLPLEQHKRLANLVGTPYVVQRFERPDQLAEGSLALYGDEAYSFSYGPEYWARIGPNTIVVRHDSG